MAGAADGSIIATIISHHIVMSAGSGGDIVAIVSGMPARRIRYAQLSATRNAMLAPTISRSWRSIRVVRSGGGADDPVGGKVEVRELRIFAVDIDLHRPARRAAGRAANLRNFIFESVGQANLPAEFGSAHRIADRFAGHLHVVGDAETPAAAIDIDREFDRCEHRLMHRLNRPG